MGANRQTAGVVLPASGRVLPRKMATGHHCLSIQY